MLDIGGGPGRYSLHLAQRGCQVTLLDLSSGNTAFAAQKAREQGLSLSVVTGDAREASRLVEGTFDHVLLMGPLYHLTEKADREQCLREALSLLREGGTLSMSFINLPSGLIYALREEPEQLLWQKPDDLRYLQNLREGEDYQGQAFTWAYFTQPESIRSFVEEFPLEILHFFGQEGIAAHNEDRLLEKPRQVQEAVLDLCEALCEKEAYWSWGGAFDGDCPETGREALMVSPRRSPFPWAVRAIFGQRHSDKGRKVLYNKQELKKTGPVF